MLAIALIESPLSAPVASAVVAALIIVLLLFTGLPQKLYSLLKDLGDAGERRVAQMKDELQKANEERDGFKADVARLLRETMVYLDGQEKDAAEIARLRASVAELEGNCITLRRDLTTALKDLEECRRGHDHAA
jgi:chromosome segregation ATPase